VSPSPPRIPYSATNSPPHELSIRTIAETQPAERFVPEIDHFLDDGSSARLPYSPARRNLRNAASEYRTLRQINTVPSDKELPYSPTNQRVLRVGLRPRRVGRARITCKYCDFAEIGSPRHNTVLSGKLYRTPPQVLPYPPTRDTVLSDKFYRTLPRVIPYSAAKHTVLSRKLRSIFTCKSGQRILRRVRTVCSCILLMSFMLFKEKDIR
jgi:hypothetical protein